MEDDIFNGGIDLSQIAESEEAVFEVDTTVSSVNNTNKENVENAEDNTDANSQEFIDNDGLDLEDIANLEEEENSSEEEESKNTTTKTNTNTPAEQKQSSSSDVLSSLASALKEAGVFSSLENDDLDIKDTETLIKAIEKQIKVNEYAFLNDTQKEYLKALEAGIPLEVYSEVQHNVKQYEDLSDEVIEKNANVTYELIRRSLIIEGVDKEKADKLAKLSLKEEDVVDQAKKAKQDLINYEKKLIQEEIASKEQEKQNKVAKEQETIQAIKSKILEKEDIIPGIKLNTQTRDKIFSSLVTPSSKNDKGDLLNEVMEKYSKDEDYKIKLHALHTITKGFTDFSKFKNTTKSKAIQELESKLQGKNSVITGSPTSLGSTTTSIKKALEGYVPSFRKK